jgi:hypothetical protein
MQKGQGRKDTKKSDYGNMEKNREGFEDLRISQR